MRQDATAGALSVGAERARYRFGPLERRGLIAGWRGGQIAAVSAGLAVAVVALRGRLSLVSIVVAIAALSAGLGLACWPLAGRTGEEWLPVVLRWSMHGLAGGRVRRSRVPAMGTCVGPDGLPCPAPSLAKARIARSGLAHHVLPDVPAFRSLSVLGVEHGSGLAGIVHDRRQCTYTAVLALQGHSFALLGTDEKERRVASWAAVLATLARERSFVHRVQWLALSLPDDGRAMTRYVADRAVLPAGSPPRESYETLVRSATTCRHEVLLAIQFLADRSAARAVRSAGGGDRGASAVLLREVSALRRALRDADVTDSGVVPPDVLAGMIRRSFEPGPVMGPVGTDGSRPRRHPPVGGPGCPPCAVGWPWPMATESHWASVRTDGTWHATYWVAEWPRVEIGADFLGPLLLGPVRRSVSVVMEPVSPSKAIRQVEQARTADVADSELRRRGGFLATARRAKESELVVRREAELADGHAAVRFSGYVTVSAPSEKLLADGCDATEQAAGQSRLELRRLFGDQERALGCTLPLCRGLS